tara:strand:- start:57 stop:302 length:246 start_codon:yes stop_codon:yes gene_type:complete
MIATEGSTRTSLAERVVKTWENAERASKSVRLTESGQPVFAPSGQEMRYATVLIMIAMDMWMKPTIYAQTESLVLDQTMFL